MSVFAGFLANTNTPTVPSAYTAANAVTLSFGASTVDALSNRPPKNICEFGRLIVELNDAAGVTQVDCFLTWDADGDHLAAGPFSSTSIVAALTDALSEDKVSVAFGLDQWVAVWPSTGTHPTLYLHLKHTGGSSTPDVVTAHLLWRQRPEMF